MQINKIMEVQIMYISFQQGKQEGMLSLAIQGMILSLLLVNC